MLKKLYIAFVIIWVLLALYTPVRGFKKSFEDYNHIDMVSLICFSVLMLGIVTHVFSGLVISAYFKLKK